ncbi:MAG: hypothetical protein ABIL58_10455 [Pseudomonadota bacterium]
MILSDQAYEIIDECKCGPEEFFVLVSSVYPGTNEELNVFLETLAKLIDENLLNAYVCGSDDQITITVDDFKSYIKKRTTAGESLDEHPSICKEYCFVTSGLGISHLKDADKPIWTMPS